MAKSRRRQNREYWDKKRRAKAQEKHVPETGRLTREMPAPRQGLHLPSTPRGKEYLMEADNGMLVNVPEEKLEDWVQMQGEEATQELTQEEEGILERVLEMLYGEPPAGEK